MIDWTSWCRHTMQVCAVPYFPAVQTLHHLHFVMIVTPNPTLSVTGEEAMQLLAEGTSRRHTGETRSNAASSRSHCVFTAILESRHVEDGITSFRTARLHLVDLAGKLPDLTSFMS